MDRRLRGACHGSSHAVSPDARIGHEVTEPSDNFGRRTTDSGRTEWRRVGGSQRRRITEGVKGVSCADVVCQFAGKRRLRRLLTCTAEIKRKSRSTRFAANRAQG